MLEGMELKASDCDEQLLRVVEDSDQDKVQGSWNDGSGKVGAGAEAAVWVLAEAYSRELSVMCKF
jgi:hypothetical protein